MGLSLAAAICGFNHPSQGVMRMCYECAGKGVVERADGEGRWRGADWEFCGVGFLWGGKCRGAVEV